MLGEEHLGQLLGYGAGSPVSSQLYCRPSRTFEIDSGMLVETFILRRDQGLDEVVGKLREFDRCPVFPIKFPQGLPIDGNDLCGQVVLRVFQLLKGGKLSKNTQGSEAEDEYGKQETTEEDPPDPLGIFTGSLMLFLLFFLCH